MRPEISKQTKDLVEEWIEENPDKGIRRVGPAIDYLILKAVNQLDKELNKEEVEMVRELLKDYQK